MADQPLISSNEDVSSNIGFVRRSLRVRKPVIPVIVSSRNGAAQKSVKKPPPPPKSRRGRDKRAVNPKYLVDARTGQQVWITAVSLQDIQSAKKRQCSPWGTQPRLVTVESAAQRCAVYERAANALEELEQTGLPRYGGRPWLCQVTINDNKKGCPYFCFGPGGLLELAAWPTILEKRPIAPSFPGHSRTDAIESLSTAEDLKYRTSSALSRLASSEAWRVPLPLITYRWISPLKETFHSRSAVWKHAEELCKKEAEIDRVLKGILPSGRKAKLQPCTQKVALATGKTRFERDGLWIVGQEEFWGREQLWGNTATVPVDHAPVITSKRRASGLSCYIESNRKDHKDQRVREIKQKANDHVVVSLQTDGKTACLAAPIHQRTRIISFTSYVDLTTTPGISLNSALAVGSTGPDENIPASQDSIPAIQSLSSEQSMFGMQSFGFTRETQTPRLVLQGNESMDASVPGMSAVSPPTASGSVIDRLSHSSGIPNQLDPSSVPTTPLNSRSVSFTLRDAEVELRSKWKKLSKEDQAKWQALADRKNQMETKESSISIVSDESADESTRDLAPQLECAPASGETSATPNHQNESSGWYDKKREEFQRSRRWCLTTTQVQQCYKAGMDHYDQIMHTVKARDLTRELQDGFDLLRERGRGRFDMELPAFEDSQYSFFNDVHKAPWMPIVRQILGKEVVLIHKGIFLSMPGAERQPYHQDGPHLNDQQQKSCHAINVFVPLVDLTIEKGPTEFCLGSHILGYDMYREELSEIPLVSAGTPVIFDYRLGHRGLSNDSSSCRPILYCTYAAAADGKEFRDSVNFSRKRYHRIGDLIEKGLSRAERARKRVRVKEDSVLEKVIAESLSTAFCA